MEDRVYGDLQLLYQGSRDGNQGSYFHAKCDDKGATITVIRSTGSFVFCGFADKPWKSSGNCCESDKAFLFSLKIPSSEVGTAKMRIKRDMCSYAMFHEYSCGPYFGDYDLRITSDANSKSS